MNPIRSYFDIASVDGKLEPDLLSGQLQNFVATLPSLQGTVFFDVAFVGRLDLLAYRVYGETRLWWVIALANGIDDPFDDSLAGQLLVIPSLTDVFKFYENNFVDPASSPGEVV